MTTGSVASGLGFSLRDRGNESPGPRPGFRHRRGGGACALLLGKESSVGAGCWAARIITARISGNGLRRCRDRLRRGRDDRLPGERPPAAPISQRARRPRWHGRYRSLPPRNTRVPGPAEIGSEGEQLPYGFASKIKQERALSSSSSAPRPRPRVNGNYSALTSVFVTRCSLLLLPGIQPLHHHPRDKMTAG